MEELVLGTSAKFQAQELGLYTEEGKDGEPYDFQVANHGHPSKQTSLG